MITTKDKGLLELLLKHSSKKVTTVDESDKSSDLFDRSSYSTVKHNNYMNIRPSAKSNWLGQLGKLGGFVVFERPEFSVRAFYKILNSYSQQGADTINKIVHKYTPKSDGDNDPATVVKFVIKELSKLGIKADKDKVITTKLYPYLAKVLMKKESGVDKDLKWFTDIYNLYM